MNGYLCTECGWTSSRCHDGICSECVKDIKIKSLESDLKCAVEALENIKKHQETLVIGDIHINRLSAPFRIAHDALATIKEHNENTN